MQRGGKGSGPTSPEVQEGGWITPWLTAEGRRPNDMPVSRWIFSGSSADRLLDPDWGKVCLSLVSRKGGEKKLLMTLSVTKKCNDESSTKGINWVKNFPGYKLFSTWFWNLRKHPQTLYYKYTVQWPNYNYANFSFISAAATWFVAGPDKWSRRKNMEAKYI